MPPILASEKCTANRVGPDFRNVITPDPAFRALALRAGRGDHLQRLDLERGCRTRRCGRPLKRPGDFHLVVQVRRDCLVVSHELISRACGTGCSDCSGGRRATRCCRWFHREHELRCRRGPGRGRAAGRCCGRVRLHTARHRDRLCGLRRRTAWCLRRPSPSRRLLLSCEHHRAHQTAGNKA